HIRHGIIESHAVLLYRADDLRTSIQKFLLNDCRADRVQVTGSYRRRVEVIEEISFLIETDDFPACVSGLGLFGDGTPLMSSADNEAVFALSSGIPLRVLSTPKDEWGLALIRCTWSKAHLKKLSAITGPLKTPRTGDPLFSETAFYEAFGLDF